MYPPLGGLALGKVEVLKGPGDNNYFTYFIPAIVTCLIMNGLYIHMSTLYIHGMNMRKQGK
ncbi:hypothetical protein A3860_20265 [Niastella vici]|uniref:Uncharacterized protein n=1 Tax=Niastella vici TaxID=1703345 RepID=A0A1V9G162_9BACT|nr:hypothetical protein A3860_20265 [Niastella vici]